MADEALAAEAFPREVGAVSQEVDFDAQPFDPALPPPRRWSFGKMLMFRTVTALAAPPGTGKTTWALQLVVAYVLNRSFGHLTPKRTGRVWVWNNEDDKPELSRRLHAACRAAGVEAEDLAGRLWVNSGADRPLVIGREDKLTGQFVATPDVDRVIEIIRRREIKLLVVDPFAETFEGNELSNDVMKAAGRLFRRIAWEGDCCVLLIVHTPKAANADTAAGDLNALRGGGALGGIVRAAYTLFDMSKKNAEELGVDADAQRLYMRLDDAKANMSLKSGEPAWWRKESVSLGNADRFDPEDWVGAFEPWAFSTPAQREAASSDETLERLGLEIVRVCRATGATAPASGYTLDALCSALDREKTKLGPSKIKSLVASDLAPAFELGDWRVVVSAQERGKLTVRKVHVEPRDALPEAA